MKTTAAAIVMAIAGLTSASAQAGTMEHVDELAAQLERQAISINYELRRNFYRSPQYNHLRSDVNEMTQLASHIHEIAHHGGNVRHLRNDVNELDRLFHHVEELIDQMRNYYTPWRRTSNNNRHWNNRHWNHGHWNQGHWNPYARRMQRLDRMVERMEDTLHHLQADLNTLAPVQRPPVYNQPAGIPIFGGRAYLKPSRRSGLGFSVNIR